MTDRDDDDRMIEALLAEARDAGPEPSAEFLARVLDDAEAVQAEFGPGEGEAAGAAEAPRGVLAGILAGLGGWRGLGGIATAGVAGIWIGFFGAGSLSDYTAGVWGQGDLAESVDLMPDYDVLALVSGTEG